MKPRFFRFRLRFRPSWWGVLLAAIGCTAAIALGNWQSRRADEKRAAAANEQRVVVRGEFVERYTVLLDNRLQGGRPGYYVVQPLRLAGGDGLHVLINRGWTAAPARREQLPEVRTPAGLRAVEGRSLERLPRAFEPAGRKAGGRVRQNLSIEEFRAETGLALQPFVIEQHSPADDGLVRDWARPDAGIEKHQSYALQWYSLAGLALILGVVLSFRRVTPE